uniref:Big-1 domain-containing protein n=1 Tax=uncultured Thiotrichaceae bacterium TaxID=298394 RepID=A0A6S6UFP0_9GAMM|nr:MAG: Unknown protein [uncultured Thiotrichaceae bacterium]
MLYKLKRLASIIAVISVASCGGGSGSDNYIVGGSDASGGGSSGGTTITDDTTATDTRIADLEIAVSSRQLASDGSDPVIISAVVKDSFNNILKDVDVKFAVDNGGTIEPDDGNATVATSVDGVSAVSGGSAVKTAKLKPGYRRDNRDLLVTVTAGNEERTIEVAVVGTIVKLNGPENVLVNSTGNYSVVLTDSGNEPLTHQVLSVVSANGNTVTPESDQGLSTDQDGKVVFDMTAHVSGVDTLTVSALGASATQNVTISGNDFSLSSANQEINLGSDEVVDLVWTRDGVPQANKVIYLSATRGVVANSVTTDVNGKASFTLSSATAGGVVLTAVENGSGLNATMVREFVATTPNYLSAQSEQSNISPEGQATILAIVRDAAYNPVKNQKVKFNIVYDTVNGSLSSPTATTDSLGRASVVYTAGNASSARDGVEIQATLQNDPTIVDAIKLSVGDRAVQLVLGHDENMAEDGVFYKKTFGIIVTDSAGNPVANKAVDFTLMPIGYYKGVMSCPADAGAVTPWYWTPTVYCPSEDLNDNAYLDEGEDFNGNGSLDPTHTATITNKKAVTDSEGKANVEVIYHQSHAYWSKLRLSASTSVEGTEYIESLEFVLNILKEDSDKCLTEPTPARISPYGIANQCESPD